MDSEDILGELNANKEKGLLALAHKVRYQRQVIERLEKKNERLKMRLIQAADYIEHLENNAQQNSIVLDMFERKADGLEDGVPVNAFDTPKTYFYFFSYSYQQNGNLGFGFADISSSPGPIDTLEELEKSAKIIKEKKGFSKVVISNFQLLRVESNANSNT